MVRHFPARWLLFIYQDNGLCDIAIDSYNLNKHIQQLSNRVSAAPSTHHLLEWIEDVQRTGSASLVCGPSAARHTAVYIYISHFSQSAVKLPPTFCHLPHVSPSVCSPPLHVLIAAPLCSLFSVWLLLFWVGFLRFSLNRWTGTELAKEALAPTSPELAAAVEKAATPMAGGDTEGLRRRRVSGGDDGTAFVV